MTTFRLSPSTRVTSCPYEMRCWSSSTRLSLGRGAARRPEQAPDRRQDGETRRRGTGVADINDRLDRLHRREAFDQRVARPPEPAEPEPAGSAPVAAARPEH